MANSGRTLLGVGPTSTIVSAGAGDQTARLTALLAAPAPLGVKQLIGSFTISGTPAVPASTYVDGSAATITQTASLTPALSVGSGSTVHGLTIVGKGTDWVNNSTVYAAAGFSLAASSTDVTIENCTITGMAGAGVYSATAPTRLRVLDCRFSGVGSPTIPASTGQYSAGVVINANGATDLTIRGGSIKDFAQGIVTGSVAGVSITGVGRISAVGQHAIYLGSVTKGVISGVRIDGTGLEGIKVQISDASPTHTDGLTIADVVMDSLGSHGVHLANTETVPGTHMARRVTIHDVVTNHTTAGNGHDVVLEYADGATVHDCIGNGGQRGIYALGCTAVKIHHNRTVGATKSGIALTSCTDSDVDHNRIVDVATANTVSDEYGIFVSGASSANIRFFGNRITDAAGNMQYCVYVAGGDLTTMAFANNTGSGASDYGFRSAVTTNAALWNSNDLAGTSGRFFNVPPNAANVANTTGATLSALETEVNKLKQRMRDFYVMN